MRNVHPALETALAPFAPVEADDDDDIRAEEVELEAFEIPDVADPWDDTPTADECDRAAADWNSDRLDRAEGRAK